MQFTKSARRMKMETSIVTGAEINSVTGGTHYSWSSNFAVNVLEDDPAKIESANFILLVKFGSRAAIGYYPLRERGAANIRIREYQYREYRGPTVLMK